MMNEYGEECCSARDLQEALEYSEWRNFIKVINKAKEGCKNSFNETSDHFVDVNKMIAMPTPEKSIKEIEKEEKKRQKELEMYRKNKL